jgi:hypothetical protein
MQWNQNVVVQEIEASIQERDYIGTHIKNTHIPRKKEINVGKEFHSLLIPYS